jgi:hypothetical protein
MADRDTLLALGQVIYNHRWNDRVGRCACGWEVPSERGAEHQHAMHVAIEVEAHQRD